jgi:tripartite-type tricarboxylate transporter receptor subunit TctC
MIMLQLRRHFESKLIDSARHDGTFSQPASTRHNMTTSNFSRRELLKAAAASASTLCLTPSFAQGAWPSKPLRLVVPFAPGGSSEIVARAVAGEMAKTIGQNVFVENKPGAAGNIAMQEVANSTDEHTLILGHIGTLAVNPYIFSKLPYDANRDFAPITLVSKVPSLYVVHPDLPVKNLTEFIAYVKSKPGQLNYGSAGNGSAGHLAFEYLSRPAVPSYCMYPTVAPAPC